MIDLSKQQAIAKICAEAAAGKLAENIMTLQVTEVSSIADFFVVATANSEPHIRAVVNAVEKELFQKMRVKCKVDGSAESQWVLLDCDGTVLMHIMSPEFRAKFQLENLWGDTVRSEKKPAAKKPAVRKTAVKKTAEETTTEKKPATKKVAAKKPAAKKPAAKKTVAKKTVAKKETSK